MTGRKIAAGDVLRLTRAASPQFVEPIRVRVVRRLDDWHTYEGWKWVDAYELNTAGDAVRRRTLYVRLAGVQWVNKPPQPDGPRRPLPRTAVRT
ncbi:hypothetical protein [Micromonospora sp. KC213]|uniref:hypothetical protein n=1 Tax=Micromonospora sp. KC213 TaxID=2530378 RepID=UPI00104BBED8|nr:hypothetical protein [Micromonospora sp. KC213]TDC28865.1 hypothetical protein E1166_30355 [Micromonospora sp. KC213]